MGKTSVYLPGDLAERVKASGVPMAELIRRGLDAGEPPPLGEVVRAAVREELEARCKAGGGRDDTRSQPRIEPAAEAQGRGEGTTGESSARDAVPRAAGAAPSRGAQPPGRRRKTDVDATPPVAVADVRAPAGTAVFQDPGSGPVVTSPVPERPARTVAEAQRQLDRAVAARRSAHADNCKCFVCKPPKGS